MGNVLSASALSTMPVEVYLSDLSDVEFKQSLGSTRFMKVAKAVNSEGLCVLKVFVHQDPSFSLDPYHEQLARVHSSLLSASNCAPFQHFVSTGKAAVLYRQYGSTTLYDRMTTRPFLTDIEKRWVAFQLLKSLEQCQQAKVCHGDIKSQNILITSWSWLLLTDFATFKPAFLPYDNPSDFTYFFDTSRRRTCNVAPERFLSTNEVSSGASPLVNLPEEYCTASLLTHQMDIFSVGCVLTELFTDGQSPFDLSQLLTYRQQKTSEISRILNLLPKNRPELSDMIGTMLHKDPKRRPTASEILSRYRGCLFPEVFYSFLWPYMERFTRQPLMTADDWLIRLKTDIDHIFERLKDEQDSTKLSSSALIVLSVVTSLVRSLNYCSSKLDVLHLLAKFAKKSSETVILDRILPYMLYFWTQQSAGHLDTFPRVRAEAIYAVTDVLKLIERLPRDDSRVFPEYVAPRIKQAIRDESSLVRMALAANISQLAETAKKFLDAASVYLSQADPQVQQDGLEPIDRSNLEITKQKIIRREYRDLQEIVQEMVVNLLCDSDNNVKRALVQNDLGKLCLFFGKQKASDVILSHMITFLNDKQDWRLRATFYDFCQIPALFIGWQSTLLLKPLLQQGLRDFEELVVFKTLVCLSSLCKNSLIQKHTLYEILPDIVPFLGHPNKWLRIATVSFLSSLEKSLNLADIHCKVMPMVNRYLTQQLIKLDKQAMLLRSLQDPLSRSVWDVLIRLDSKAKEKEKERLLEPLLNFLSDKHTLRRLNPAQSALGNISNYGYSPENEGVAKIYQTLINLGLTEENEEKLLVFKEILIKMGSTKPNNSSDFSPTSEKQPGTVNLASMKVVRKHASLTEHRKKQYNERRQKLETAIDAAMNEEWQEMFGLKPTETPSQQPTPTDLPAEEAFVVEQSDSQLTTDGEVNINEVVDEEKQFTDSIDTESLSQSIEHTPLVDTSSAMDKQVRMSQCRLALVDLVEWKRSEWHRGARFAVKSLTNAQIGSELDNVSSHIHSHPQPPLDWRPTGRLVAHLHEHKAAVNRLALHPEGYLFASCSADGTVKLWDCKRMEGSSMANRARLTYSGLGDRVRALSFLSDGTCLACAGDNSVLQILQLEGNKTVDSKNTLTLKTDPVNEGPIVDMSTWWDGCNDLLVAVTHHGYLICWDLRLAKNEGPAWKFQNPSQDGLITAFCLDSHWQQWICLGTTSGKLILWDMRFQLPVNWCSHPVPNRRIVRLWPSKSGSSSSDTNSNVWCSVLGNGEVSEWNLESGSRLRAVWPSEHAPLSYQQTSNLSTSAFIDCNSTMLLSGDTTGALRMWDTIDSRRSQILSSSALSADWSSAAPPARQPIRQRLYKTHHVDGIPVITETKLGAAQSKGSGAMAASKPLDLQVATWHKDSISDMLVCTSGHQWFLASSSRDGVVKVWK